MTDFSGACGLVAITLSADLWHLVSWVYAISQFHSGWLGSAHLASHETCLQAILGRYLGECQAIQDAITAAANAKAAAEDRYASARTQQQAEAAEADIKSSTAALAQVASLTPSQERFPLPWVSHP